MTLPVADHYSRDRLLQAITDGLGGLGLTTNQITVDDLAPVDEFHIGGRPATKAFFDGMEFQRTDHLLDIGCGLGGAARYAASRLGTRITGMDLTADFVNAGNALCRWVGLANRIQLILGNALKLPFGPESFEGAYMLHVGMNIEEKPLLFGDIHRVLRPGARLGIYDAIRLGEEELTFPLPWASGASMDHAVGLEVYEAALQEAGFRLAAVRDRREFALAFYERRRKVSGKKSGMPGLGLHLLMGSHTRQKVGNMLDALNRGLIAPMELVAEKK